MTGAGAVPRNGRRTGAATPGLSRYAAQIFKLGNLKGRSDQPLLHKLTADVWS